MLERIKGWWRRRNRDGAGAAAAGESGERAARRFLEAEAGYRVVACNWRSPDDRRDEIDLVCRDRGVLVFVEVKARAAGALVSGYHAVTSAKKKILRRACTDYLRRLEPRSRPPAFRFDIVEVELGEGGGKPGAVRHFENVPLFPKHLRW